ncbi:transposase, partial [Deinococcus sp.]|uniref:IS110 family transposase n=1 Tax=Deinococcus sp. TaxID=47478 RepID=UPI0038D3B787
DKFVAWCAQLPADCIVAMETSSSAHHWARKLIALGLDARIIAAQLVSPYRRQGVSGKNDANDAAAICEAAGRPQMHFVPVKSIEQQSMLCVHRLREGFKADRVACRGHTVVFTGRMVLRYTVFCHMTFYHTVPCVTARDLSCPATS